MTKLELQQINTRLAAENAALRAENDKLRVQSIAPKTGHSGFQAQMDIMRANPGSKLVGGKVVFPA